MTDEQFLRHIMPDIEEYFIHNNRGIIIIEGYEWFREIITLYAKQHNLLEAAIVLVDAGMNEEAIILARSAMNNYFLIGYLLNDDSNRNHLKEYQAQPLISQKYSLENTKKMLNGAFGQRMKQRNIALSFTVEDIKNKINEIKREIATRGLSHIKKPLSVISLAKETDEHGFGLYTTYYADASRFEHSDITSLDIYKKPVDEETPATCAFIMDLNRTDEKLKEKIFDIFSISYLDSFIKIVNKISKTEKHLESNYDMKKLKEIIMKILECM